MIQGKTMNGGLTFYEHEMIVVINEALQTMHIAVQALSSLYNNILQH